jgi:hypothetical protein
MSIIPPVELARPANHGGLALGLLALLRARRLLECVVLSARGAILSSECDDVHQQQEAEYPRGPDPSSTAPSPVILAIATLDGHRVRPAGGCRRARRGGLGRPRLADQPDPVDEEHNSDVREHHSQKRGLSSFELFSARAPTVVSVGAGGGAAAHASP